MLRLLQFVHFVPIHFILISFYLFFLFLHLIITFTNFHFAFLFLLYLFSLPPPFLIFFLITRFLMYLSFSSLLSRFTSSSHFIIMFHHYIFYHTITIFLPPFRSEYHTSDLQS